MNITGFILSVINCHDAGKARRIKKQQKTMNLCELVLVVVSVFSSLFSCLFFFFVRSRFSVLTYIYNRNKKIWV